MIIRIMSVSVLMSLSLHTAENLSSNGQTVSIIESFLQLPTLVPVMQVLWANKEIAHRKAVGFYVDAQGEERRSELYAYTAAQRQDAQPRFEGAALGLGTQLISDQIINFPQVPLLTSMCRLRNNTVGVENDNRWAVGLEQSLVPAACYVESKKMIDALIPQSHPLARSLIAIGAGLGIANAFVASGVTPERLVIAAWMYHGSSYYHNKYLHNSSGFKHVAASLKHASTIVPFVQMVARYCTQKPSMFNMHPTRGYICFETIRKDYAYGVIPVLVHAGVDFTFNVVAETHLGRTVEARVINPLVLAALQQLPIPKDKQEVAARVTKKGLAKVTTLVATGVALNSCPIQ